MPWHDMLMMEMWEKMTDDQKKSVVKRMVTEKSL